MRVAVIDGIIRAEEDGTISLGDYESPEKKKVEDFDVEGDLYKVKTFNEITRLEKNGKLLLETTPGTAVHHLAVNASGMRFGLEGRDDTRVTAELEPECLYRIMIDGVNIGNVKASVSGKVIFSLDLSAEPLAIQIIKPSN